MESTSYHHLHRDSIQYTIVGVWAVACILNLVAISRDRFSDLIRGVSKDAVGNTVRSVYAQFARADMLSVSVWLASFLYVSSYLVNFPANPLLADDMVRQNTTFDCYDVHISWKNFNVYLLLLQLSLPFAILGIRLVFALDLAEQISLDKSHDQCSVKNFYHCARYICTFVLVFAILVASEYCAETSLSQEEKTYTIVCFKREAIAPVCYMALGAVVLGHLFLYVTQTHPRETIIRVITRDATEMNPKKLNTEFLLPANYAEKAPTMKIAPDDAAHSAVVFFTADDQIELKNRPTRCIEGDSSVPEIRRQTIHLSSAAIPGLFIFACLSGVDAIGSLSVITFGAFVPLLASLVNACIALTV